MREVVFWLLDFNEKSLEAAEFVVWPPNLEANDGKVPALGKEDLTRGVCR